jgi:hypothetical protein
MARDYLAIPTSLAPLERVFSTSGDIITKKRNRIRGENLWYLLYLRSWGIIPEDDDLDEEVNNRVDKEGIIVVL